jgi:DNA-binding MarR family transcriptional regulator
MASEDFGILLARAYIGFVEALRSELAAEGYDDLHGSFGYVARALAEEPLTLRDLAVRLGITSQGALKIVDDMEAHGYLERRADPSDGRAKRLGLTKRGERALAAARAIHRRFERALADRFGKRKVAIGRAMLEEVVASGERDGKGAALRPI